MREKRRFSWKARGLSFVYAFRGIRMLLGGEHNAWIHCTVAVAVVVAGFALGLSAMEWCVVALCIGGVLMAEAFNSALEALADHVSPEYAPLVGRCKDIAAGGVLLFVGGAVAAGLIIFLPKFLALFG